MDLVIKSTKERPLIRLFTPQKISDYLEKSKKEKPLITYENNTNINDNNLQNTYVELDKNYLELFNKYFPLIRQSHKQFKDKPYVTSGIKESIKSRNALYKAYRANPTEANEIIWKNKKNRIVDILRKSESDYYATIINNHAESSKMLWKTMGNILNKTKSNHSTINNLKTGNAISNDPQEITGNINNYFCTIGEELANKFKNSGNNEYKKAMLSPMTPKK